MSSPMLDDESDKTRCFCPDWLIDAIYETVHRSPVRAKVMAERLHRSVDLLYKWATEPGNPSLQHRCMPLKFLHPLCQAAENTYLLDVHERQAGRTIPEAIAPYHGPLAPLAHELMAQLAEGLALLTEAQVHGDLTAAGISAKLPALRVLRRQLDQVESAVLAGGSPQAKGAS